MSYPPSDSVRLAVRFLESCSTSWSPGCALASAAQVSSALATSPLFTRAWQYFMVLALSSGCCFMTRSQANTAVRGNWAAVAASASSLLPITLYGSSFKICSATSMASSGSFFNASCPLGRSDEEVVLPNIRKKPLFLPVRLNWLSRSASRHSKNPGSRRSACSKSLVAYSRLSLRSATSPLSKNSRAWGCTSFLSFLAFVKTCSNRTDKPHLMQTTSRPAGASFAVALSRRVVYNICRRLSADIHEQESKEENQEPTTSRSTTRRKRDTSTQAEPEQESQAPGQAEEEPEPDEPEPEEEEELPPPTPKELKELRQQAAKAEEYYDRLQRQVAEADNLRKRLAKEKQDAVRYANESLIEELLPTMDSFEMAMSAPSGTRMTSTIDSLKTGIEMVLHPAQANARGGRLVTEIDATGQAFDPSQHEAVSRKKTDEAEEGTVIEQTRKGYRLKDRLLRAASVVVAAPSGDAEEGIRAITMAKRDYYEVLGISKGASCW